MIASWQRFCFIMLLGLCACDKSSSDTQTPRSDDGICEVSEDDNRTITIHCPNSEVQFQYPNAFPTATDLTITPDPLRAAPDTAHAMQPPPMEMTIRSPSLTNF